MNTFEEIFEKIKAYDTIIIHRHQRPDPDALGSQAGLRELIKHNFPTKKVLATGFDEPTLAWITTMDEVSDSDYDGALVIVTDTANTPRIDDERYTKGDCLIKIDHHPNEDVYGDLLYVNTNALSASEIISDFAFSTGLALSSESARLLYSGIVGDTGRFLYPATSSKTFMIASKLREYDFDFSSLARQMDSISFKIAKLQGFVYDNLEVDDNGAARVVLTQETMKKYNVTEAETSAIVGFQVVSIVFNLGQFSLNKLTVTTVFACVVKHKSSTRLLNVTTEEVTHLPAEPILTALKKTSKSIKKSKIY